MSTFLDGNVVITPPGSLILCLPFAYSQVEDASWPLAVKMIDCPFFSTISCEHQELFQKKWETLNLSSQQFIITLIQFYGDLATQFQEKDYFLLFLITSRLDYFSPAQVNNILLNLKNLFSQVTTRQNIIHLYNCYFQMIELNNLSLLKLMVEEEASLEKITHLYKAIFKKEKMVFEWLQSKKHCHDPIKEDCIRSCEKEIENFKLAVTKEEKRLAAIKSNQQSVKDVIPALMMVIGLFPDKQRLMDQLLIYFQFDHVSIEFKIQADEEIFAGLVCFSKIIEDNPSDLDQNQNNLVEIWSSVKCSTFLLLQLFFGLLFEQDESSKELCFFIIDHYDEVDRVIIPSLCHSVQLLKKLKTGNALAPRILLSVIYLWVNDSRQTFKEELNEHRGLAEIIEKLFQKVTSPIIQNRLRWSIENNPHLKTSSRRIQALTSLVEVIDSSHAELHLPLKESTILFLDDFWPFSQLIKYFDEFKNQKEFINFISGVMCLFDHALEVDSTSNKKTRSELCTLSFQLIKMIANDEIYNYILNILLNIRSAQVDTVRIKILNNFIKLFMMGSERNIKVDLSILSKEATYLSSKLVDVKASEDLHELCINEDSLLKYFGFSI